MELTAIRAHLDCARLCAGKEDSLAIRNDMHSGMLVPSVLEVSELSTRYADPEASRPAG